MHCYSKTDFTFDFGLKFDWRVLKFDIPGSSIFSGLDLWYDLLIGFLTYLAVRSFQDSIYGMTSWLNIQDFSMLLPSLEKILLFKPLVF